MGDIWKALDTQLQRVVVIKTLRTDIHSDPSFGTRFEREAQLVAALHHPNIVQVHDFDVAFYDPAQKTVAYMVMDYVQGQTLADYIQHTSRQRQFPSPQEVLYLLTGISLALDYAHQQGMIHRDIKPANILLDQRLPTAMSMGEPILTDFGIARLQSVSSGTIIGSIMGTPNYISPEQARGKQGDARSDLYSLGIIVYEMMVGSTPFHGESMISLLMQHINDSPPSPMELNPQLSPDVSAVILKSIAKEPEDRYSTASAMTIALAQALSVAVPRRLLAAQRGHVQADMPSLAPSASALQWRNISGGHVGQIDTQQPYQTPNAKQPVEPMTPVEAPSLPQQPRRSRRLPLLLLAVAIIVVLGSGLAALLLTTHTQSPPSPPPVGQVGHILFTHSTTAPTGSYDTLQITLTTLAAPPANYTYYAWIDATNVENTYPHWQLTVQNGSVQATGLTDPSYNRGNLLAQPGLFLITRELTTGQPPIIPNLEPGSRLYYAQITPGNTSFSLQACPAGNLCYVG